jgi:hypothetical protein
MAPHQIPLQRPHLARLNPHIRKLPKPRIDAIGSLAARQHPIDHGARSANARHRGRIERSRPIPKRNLANFVKAQSLTGKQKWRGHHE